MSPTDNVMDKLVSLAKRRGFVFQSSEIYGGLGSVWDYGPLGVELKKNIKERWWRSMVHDREDIEGLDAAILMHPKVWEASGHVSGFSDPLVDCKHCKNRFRADDPRIKGTPGEPTAQCPVCGSKGTLTAPRMFNLMFKTFMGPVEEAAAVVYLRPETAQGIYVNFLNVLQSSRQKVPFGIAQIGKAFRNEITPGNFTFRTREFEQMEMQFFVKPGTDQEWFAFIRPSRRSRRPCSRWSTRMACPTWRAASTTTCADTTTPSSTTAAPSADATGDKTRRGRHSASPWTARPPRTARSRCGTGIRWSRSASRPTGSWDTWLNGYGGDVNAEVGTRNAEQIFAPPFRVHTSAFRVWAGPCGWMTSASSSTGSPATYPPNSRTASSPSK